MYSSSRHGLVKVMPTPDFLPELIPFDGVWSELEEAAYGHFCGAFIDGRTEFHGSKIVVDGRIDKDGKENGFWHLVERKDRKTGERLPVIGLAQRLPWIPVIIGNAGNASVTSFRYLEGSMRVRQYLWVKDADFVVILGRKRNIHVLITAFVVDSDWKRTDLEKKYEKRER